VPKHMLNKPRPRVTVVGLQPDIQLRDDTTGVGAHLAEGRPPDRQDASACTAVGGEACGSCLPGGQDDGVPATGPPQALDRPTPAAATASSCAIP